MLKERRGEKWIKNFMIGTVINFFLYLNYFLLMVIIADYAMKRFGASAGMAGFTAGIFIIGALGARLFCGRWLDSIGRRKTLIWGAAADLLMSVSYFFVNGAEILLFVRFVHGFAYGFVSTAVGSAVTDIIPKEIKGEGIGYYMLSTTLGAAVGPFLGIFFLNHGGFPMIFALCSAAAALCLINALLFKMPRGAADVQNQTNKKCGLSGFFELNAVPISAVCALIYFCYSSLLSFLTPYADKIGLNVAASFFFIVYSLTMLISRPFSGRLFDSRGEKTVMIPAFISFMIGMAILSGASGSFTMLLSAAFIGLGIGAIQPGGLAIAVKASPPGSVSLVNSTYFIFLDIGVGIGPLILGLLIPCIGYRGMYLAMAFVTAVCLFLYLLTLKNKPA